MDQYLQDLMDRAAAATTAASLLIEPAVDQVIADNGNIVSQVRSGKDKALNALIGKVRSKVADADPMKINEVLRRKIF